MSTPSPVASSADLRVHVDVDQGRLHARVRGAEAVEGASFAFYLLHDGRRVEATRYGPSRTVVFETVPGEGRYRVRVFLRAPALAEPMVTMSLPVTREGASAGQRLLAEATVRAVEVDGIAPWAGGAGWTRLDVRSGGLVHECLLGPRRGEALFVVLGGAVPPRERAALPRFSRFTWAGDFPGTLLCVADPTLRNSPTLRLGWYFGTRAHDAIGGLVPIVRATAAALGVPSERIVAWGSSGGGFAALRLAAALGGHAAAVAINAQVSIPRYGKRAFVDEFAATCLPGEDLAHPDAALRDRIDVTDAWARTRDARALLVQNSRDPHHRDEHFRPFVRAVGGAHAAHVVPVMYSHPDGHGAEPREMLPQLLARLAALVPPAVRPPGSA